MTSSAKVFLKFFGIAAALFISVFVMPWLMLAGGTVLARSPAKPAVTYGEFPFELTYKIDGQTITVKDTFVCEYAGVDAYDARGKSRKWNGYIKGTGERYIELCKVDEGMCVAYLGDARYYMGDWDVRSTESGTSEDLMDNIPVYLLNGVEPENYDPLNIWKVDITSEAFENALEEHGFQVLQWKYTEPICNTFEQCRFFWF